MRRSILIGVGVVCIVLLLFFIYHRQRNEGGDILNSKHYNGTEAMETEHKDGLKGEEQLDVGVGKLEHKYQRGEFQAGMNLLIYGQPDISNAQKLFKHLRSLGINSVAIVYPFFQSDWQADYVEMDPDSTPTIAGLEELILSAHDEDLTVMLRPILDEKTIMSSGHWRGTIKPQNPELWFHSYRSLLLTYAELAQKTNVEILNIGTELNSLQNNEYSDEWFRIINEIRDVYQGQLIYSFNWDCFRDIPSIDFVSMLDYIGIDAYYPLDAPDDASVDELEEAWEVWIREIKEILIDESIVITEVGMIPIVGAHRIPYTWNIPRGKLNWRAQAHYYESTYNVWNSIVEGIYWWGTTIQQSGAFDYSPIGTPTEGVIRKMFLKQRPEGLRD